MHSGYPRGWFLVAFSEELAPSEVRPLRYFGRDLVLFRSETGEPAMLDAHCPHLGAHMGVGGTVQDGTLRCPFHAWRFGPDGRCVDVPYAKRIPKQAAVDAWTLRESHGLIFARYDRDGVAPEWEIPALEVGPDHREWRWDRLRVATHPREIVENVVDIAHFAPVHQTEPHQFDNRFEGHRAVQYSRGVGSEDNQYAGSSYDLVATYYGPGYQITEFTSRGVNAILLNAHTMVDEGHLDLCFGVRLREMQNPDHTDRFLEAYFKDLSVGFQQDIAIWEHKRWRDRPTLSDEDGDIGRLRHWYAQFYT